QQRQIVFAKEVRHALVVRIDHTCQAPLDDPWDAQNRAGRMHHDTVLHAEVWIEQRVTGDDGLPGPRDLFDDRLADGETARVERFAVRAARHAEAQVTRLAIPQNDIATLGAGQR